LFVSQLKYVSWCFWHCKIGSEARRDRDMKAEPSIIFGINAILEKLKASPDEIAEIFVSGGAAAQTVRTTAARLGVRVSRVTGAVLDRMALGQRHQGVVARVAAFHYGSLEDLLDSSAGSLPERVLILDGVTDPRNFGALLRCADGAGVAHVVIAKDRSAGVTSTVVKASAGAAHHVNVYRVTNLRRAMERLKQSGYWLAGLDAGATTSIYGRSYPEKLGVVLGSEGQGMRPLVREQCDFLVSIPMSGRVASLNVAVAGAVFLYEIKRQQAYPNVDNGKTKR
jgi:23S rRNA (guanosine2251-2'-O)-methyltransferase